MLARDIMDTRFHTIHPGDTLADAFSTFVEQVRFLIPDMPVDSAAVYS